MNYADIKQYDVANGLGTEFPCLSAAVRIIVKTALIKKLGISGLEIPLPTQRLKKSWNI